MGSMHVEFSDDIEQYAGAVLPFLEHDPVRCNVPLSVIANTRAGASAVHGSWVCDDEELVVGTASWTPPFELLLSTMTEAAALVIAEAWAGWFDRGLGGVVGPEAVARACAQHL